MALGGLRRGDIVIANIPDPAGAACDHRHPAMVLMWSPTATNCWLVGISTKFDPPPPRHWLELPSAPGGHPVTGLRLPSVLKCDWIKSIAVSVLEKRIGAVPAEVLKVAMDRIDEAAHKAEAEANRPK